MYGLPTGTHISYGAAGFPPWVYELGKAFNLKASTYAGHQETDRRESGFAPNPQRLNRGIDWVGATKDMQRFADYLLTVRQSLEQVIWSNPSNGNRVGVAGGKEVTVTGYYADDYSNHRDHVHTRQSAPIPLPEASVSNKPAYNEFPLWSPSYSSRGGTKIDAVLIHTQEGGGGDAAAENLAKYLGVAANKVSYHYTISQAADGGVTVVDVVDTDYASWSVLSANSRSINLCFAGSKASWSREQWMKQAKAIDVAAYLVVQDCKKYGISTTVIPPPYTGRLPGISDHAYVTKVLKDGTHTDVGSNFPWPEFTAAINKYSGEKPPVTPVPPTAGSTRSDRQLLEEIWDQLRGPGGKGWPQLGGKSLVDGLAELLKGKG